MLKQATRMVLKESEKRLAALKNSSASPEVTVAHLLDLFEQLVMALQLDQANEDEVTLRALQHKVNQLEVRVSDLSNIVDKEVLPALPSQHQ